MNSALNCTRKPISHESLRDSCDIGFRVQFNAEFSSQVINFPIELERVENPALSRRKGGWATKATERNINVRCLMTQLSSSRLSRIVLYDLILTINIPAFSFHERF